MSAIPRNSAFLAGFALYDSAGNLKTAAAGLAQRVSKDGAASAASANAIAEIDAANMPGEYELQLTATEMDAGLVVVKITGTGLRATTLTLITEPDIYTAKVALTIDNVNAIDRWEVTWFKNAVPYAPTAGVPQIHVVRAADGSNLIAATNMTQIGATGRWKYEAAGVERASAGAGYYVTMTATIDGALRTWDETKGLGRDT